MDAHCVSQPQAEMIDVVHYIRRYNTVRIPDSWEATVRQAFKALRQVSRDASRASSSAS